VPADASDSASPSLVSRTDLEERLALLKQRVHDPRGGIFGPGSKVWEVNKESLVFLGAGRAALLQLAHPFVAHAIDQHSATRGDPFGRFQRTFGRVFAMVFGDLDEAFRAARGVHALHGRIHGEIPERAGPFAAHTPYFANEPEALLWVHATLWDTSILCYETVRRALGDDEKERYYEETKRFAYLFGIPDAVLPATWADFRRYMDRMLESEVLTVTPCAADMAGFLLRPLLPGLGPLMSRYARFTAWLLPERLATGFGLERGGEAGAAAHARDLERLRTLLPWLPRRLRHIPAYVEARRRLAGRTDRDYVGELLSRAMVGRARR
jgi:uncharacterized protein (DUF2236 family)